jgi:hypothetical protein
MNVTDFTSDNNGSNLFQQITMTWLKGNGFEVQDVSKDRTYQSQDIDMVITKGGKRTTVEFKADKVIATSGNLYFEIVSNLEKGTPGCLVYCKAEWLYYYDQNNHKLHAIRMTYLRAKLSAIPINQLRIHRSRTGFDGGYYTTVGVTIPLSAIKDLAAKDQYHAHDLSAFAQEAHTTQTKSTGDPITNQPVLT